MSARKDRIIKTLEGQLKARKEHALAYYEPYPKQQEFHCAGAQFSERLLMAANQVGKTLSGSRELAMHLTGEYPEWWQGRRWDRPTKWWAGSNTGELTRGGVQRLLMGEPGVVAEQGTGAIPRAAIIDTSLAHGTSDLFDTIQVRHISGGVSILKLKSYDQGRAKWQSETLDGLWMDEEPPEDIYNEGLARITATKGLIFLTATPLLGWSDVVLRFFEGKFPSTHVTTMTIDDAPHISPEDRKIIISRYAPHEREARTKGVPAIGQGKIFPVAEEAISEPRIPFLPPHWHYLWGIDFGIAHPFAAVLNGWDKDADIIHVLHTVRMSDTRPIDHAAAMNAIMPGAPVAWPHDGMARESSGETLASQYRKHGLKMLPHHSTFPDGGFSTEAGVMEMWERMTTGRYKVASHLTDWWDEFRLYHRDKNGLIVKKRDDLMSASRIGVMMRRYAKQMQAFIPRREYARPREPLMAKDIDIDPWGN